MKTLSITLLSALLLTLSLDSRAATGTECQYDMVPAYSCLNPNPGPDVRLIIMEFQTCKDGKVAALDRIEDVTYFADDTISVEKQDLKINYNSERKYYDRANRGDDLTFIMPESLEGKVDDKIIKMTFTNKLVPLYRGALEHHMKGTFSIENDEGRVLKKGSLTCSINR